MRVGNISLLRLSQICLRLLKIDIDQHCIQQLLVGVEEWVNIILVWHGWSRTGLEILTNLRFLLLLELLSGIILIVVVAVNNFRIRIDGNIQLFSLANFINGSFVDFKYLGPRLLVFVSARSLLHLGK